MPDRPHALPSLRPFRISHASVGLRTTNTSERTDARDLLGHQRRSPGHTSLCMGRLRCSSSTSTLTTLVSTFRGEKASAQRTPISPC